MISSLYRVEYVQVINIQKLKLKFPEQWNPQNIYYDIK